MKARIIATGKIVDVVANGNYYDTTDNKERYYSHELDFNDTANYWTRLEHQYAGQFMQAMISSPNYIDVSEEAMADASLRIAHALVEKLKESK